MSQSFSDVLLARKSVRAFTSQPISETTLRDIVDLARRAPSGGNLQPWKLIAVSGAAREAVIALARAAQHDQNPERPIYPPALWEPYRSRRFKVGEDMYEHIGIGRDDRAARLRHVGRNFEFFGAPVGLFFAIDTRMGHGQWAHLGMFILALALAAQERGLATCIQEAWANLRGPLKAHFALPDNEMIYCGMALGFEDANASINRLRSDRAPLSEFAVFRSS